MANLNRNYGFNLTEVLIAMGILGVLAAFTIPKLLSSQQNAEYNAIAKEAIVTVSGMYNAYQIDGTPTSATHLNDLTPYLNYVRQQTTGSVDRVQTSGSLGCSTQKCYVLHNGAVLWYYDDSDYTFQGTSSTHALEFYLDPDGEYSGSTTGPGKSLQVFLYYDGRLSPRPYISTPTYSGSGSLGPNNTFTPDWFSSWN